MSDKLYKYMGFTIAKNTNGYRVCFVSLKPVFDTLNEAQAWIRSL